MANKILSILDNFFGHLADYERFVCDFTFVTGPGIFQGGTNTEIFKLRLISLVRIPAVLCWLFVEQSLR